MQSVWVQRIVQVSRYRGEALGLDCSKQNLRRARFYLAHFSLFPFPLTERNYDAYFNLLHRSNWKTHERRPTPSRRGRANTQRLPPRRAATGRTREVFARQDRRRTTAAVVAAPESRQTTCLRLAASGLFRHQVLLHSHL